MPGLRRPDQQPQAAALFGGQLQSPKGPPVEPIGPCQHRGHARAAERLVQRPIVVGPIGGVDDDQVLQFDVPPCGRGRIELSPPIEHDQCPPITARPHGGGHGQRFRAATLAVGQPLDDRPPAKPPPGQ